MIVARPKSSFVGRLKTCVACMAIIIVAGRICAAIHIVSDFVHNLSIGHITVDEALRGIGENSLPDRGILSSLMALA